MRNVVGFLILLLLSPFAQAQIVKNFDLKHFSELPVLHEGRMKPMDTFARSNLLMIYGKSSLKDLTATEWLVELLFDEDRAYDRKVFNVQNPDVVKILDLEWSLKHRYSFREVSKGLRKNADLLKTILPKDKKELTIEQNQMVELYSKNLQYFEIARSLSLIKPIFVVPSEKVAKQLEIEVGKAYTYLELNRWRPMFNKVVEEMQDVHSGKTKGDFKGDKDLMQIAYQHSWVGQDAGTQSFRVIPPQWEENKDTWFSLWGIVQAGRGSPASAKLFQKWRGLIDAYSNADRSAWEKESYELLGLTREIAGGALKGNHLKLELAYNKIDLFTKSIAFYILAFLLLAISTLIWKEKLYKAVVVVMTLGWLLHLAGLIMRIIIMGRPPVSTLYESVIFVGFVAVTFGLGYEAVRRNGLGVLIGALIGAVLHFIGFGYAAKGDSMGMLVAVLDSNFWLATHVVTISTGYGCGLVAGLVGHIYLFRRIRNSNDPQLPEIYKNMVGISLFALFFCLFGTILGGIWADQSWGRFWGWDPKENGALLICLWLLVAIHGRLAGKMKALGYALAMCFTNIIVALAWFGVNLLNVGLHSYGFTENIAYNLAAFCILQMVVIIGAWVTILFRESKNGVKTA